MIVVARRGLSLVTRPIAPGPGRRRRRSRSRRRSSSGPATEGLRPGDLAPELEATRADGSAGHADRPRRQARPPRRPARQARVAQLLGDLVPALPGRDAGPARHGRRSTATGASRSSASRSRRRRSTTCAPTRSGTSLGYTIAFDASADVFDTVQGVRAADAGLHRARRHGAAGRQRAADGRDGAAADRGLAARSIGQPAPPAPVEPGGIARRLRVAVYSAARSGTGRGPATSLPDRRSQPRATARRSSRPRPLAGRARPCASTLSSGKSSNAVTQRGFADHGRMHRSPKNASDRAPGPVPRTTTAWCPAECPPVRTTDTPGQQLPVALGPALGAPVRDQPQLRLVVGGDEPAVVPERDLPLRALGDDPAPAGTPAIPSARSRPPAWSKWRWLIATTSTVAGSKPASRSAGHDRRARVPAHRACSSSSIRSPIPVSISTRPAGVSTSRQLSAWSSRRFSSSSPSAQCRHRTHGTGPSRAPASDRNVPAWTSATRCPAAEVRAPVDGVVDARGSALRPGPCRPRSKSAWNADAVGSDWPWYLRAELLAAVRPLHRRAHPEEADLPDPHPGVQGDRQVGDVGQLEGQRPLPARVDVARGRVDEEARGGPASSCPRGGRRGRPAAPPTRASGPGRTRRDGG